MVTIKSFSDLPQSKKLAEILPIESADMYWWSSGKRYYIEAMDDGDFNEGEGHIRAWSLAALLDILAKQDFIIKSSERNDEYKYNIDIPIRHCKIWFSSLLDAAFEMVCWLKENNKL